jgi:hypothetical protein
MREGVVVVAVDHLRLLLSATAPRPSTSALLTSTVWRTVLIASAVIRWRTPTSVFDWLGTQLVEKGLGIIAGRSIQHPAAGHIHGLGGIFVQARNTAAGQHPGREAGQENPTGTHNQH